MNLLHCTIKSPAVFGALVAALLLKLPVRHRQAARRKDNGENIFIGVPDTKLALDKYKAHQFKVHAPVDVVEDAPPQFSIPVDAQDRFAADTFVTASIGMRLQWLAENGLWTDE